MPKYPLPTDAALAIHGKFLEMRRKFPTLLTWENRDEEGGKLMQWTIEGLDENKLADVREMGLRLGAVAMAVLMELGNE